MFASIIYPIILHLLVILMKEFYNFIKNHMKREIKREDFDKENEDTYYMIMRYKNYLQ
jgi:hypothetical protein